MKYNIISITDERKAYKDAIRRYTKLEEYRIASMDARAVDPIEELNALGLTVHDWHPLLGELGAWLSHFLCWKFVSVMSEPLIVFEDDAIINNAFDDILGSYMSELPPGWDFMSLWAPDDQQQDYRYDVVYDDDGIANVRGWINGPSRFDIGKTWISRAYQGYGLVGTVYSPEGGSRLVERAKQRGVCTPVDCFIFQESHTERVKGYAPKPLRNIVFYDWKAPTTVHNTEKV